MRTGLLWSGASLAATKLGSFVLILVLARLVAPADFGALAAIVVFTELLLLGSDLGMKATVVYEQEQGLSERVQSAFTMNLILAGLLTIAGVLVAPVVAGFFDLQEETWLFRLGALSIVLTALGNIQDGLLLRALSFRRRLVPDVARVVVRAGVSIPLAAAGLGPEALVFGLLAGIAAWTATQWALSPFRPAFSFDPSIARSMVSYGVGASLLSALSVVHNRIDVAAIGNVLGERALGLYTIAFRVPEVLIESVAITVSQVAFPGLSQKRARDRAGLGTVAEKLLRYQTLYAFPVAAGLAVMATPTVVVLFGQDWRSAGGVASAIAVHTAIGASVFPLGDVFKAIGRQRTFALVNAIVLPVTVGVIVVAAPAGIVAVAWARVAMRTVVAAVVTALVSRALRTGVAPFMRAVLPALIASAGVAGGAAAARMAVPGDTVVALITGLGAGALAGLVCLRLFAAAAFDDLRDLLGAATRRSAASEP